MTGSSDRGGRTLDLRLRKSTFKDINKLKLDQNPGDAVPASGDMKKSGGSGSGKVEPVTFKFTKGASCTS